MIEQRFGAGKLDSDGDGVGADELHVLAHIGVGHDQRVLDQRMGLLREQPVEAAVERDAGDHRHQDGGHRGDDGEQGDDAHVQSRRRAAAPPRLHHPPHLARNDEDEQEHGAGVDGEEKDHDLVGRHDRGEAGEHHEGDQRR